MTPPRPDLFHPEFFPDRWIGTAARLAPVIDGCLVLAYVPVLLRFTPVWRIE